MLELVWVEHFSTTFYVYNFGSTFGVLPKSSKINEKFWEKALPPFTLHILASIGQNGKLLCLKHSKYFDSLHAWQHSIHA